MSEMQQGWMNFRKRIKNSVFLTLSLLLILPVTVLAEALPSPIPPTGYDTYRANIPHGTQRDVTYYSSVAGRDLVMKVYTPPQYDPTNLNKRYGVVYCYQGIGVDPGTIFADWCCGAGILCDNLIADGQLADGLIIVALDDQFNGDYSDVQGMTITDAIPFVDANYRTYPYADNRGVYGYSWGGGYTFNVGCANLDTFHYLSPSAAAPNKAGDTTLFPNGGADAKEKLKCLLITWGQYDYQSIIDSNKAAVQYCLNNNIPHYSWEVAGQGHSAGVWRPALWHFLKLAMQKGIMNSPIPTSALSQVEAEAYYSKSSAIQAETCSEGGKNLGFIQNGAYLVYKNVDFGSGAFTFNARVASATSGGDIELYLDSLTGVQIGRCQVAATGGWQTWVTKTCSIGNVSGIHDLYVKFTGASGYLMNINWWRCGQMPGIDIGTLSVPGSDSYNKGVVTITSAGDDIWNASDAFRFVNASANGDYSITARVNALQNVDPWSKAGVMIRQSLDANAANVILALTPGNGLTFQYRLTAGGATSSNVVTGLKAPYWVRLVRGGNVFTGYYSADGINWIQAGSTTISMTATSYAGLALTSHNAANQATAIFDNVTAPNWPTFVAPTGVLANPVGTSRVDLTWDKARNASSYNVKRATTSGGPYTALATGITTNSYSDTSVALGTTYYYVISKMVAGSETPVSAQISSAVRNLHANLKFEESSGITVADSTGNGWSGTLVNGPAWSAAGKVGRALNFDGTDDHVTLPAGVVSSLTDFTIATWVKLDTVSSWSRIFDFGSGTAINMFLTPKGGSGVVRFAIKQSDSAGEQIINGDAAIPTGVWTHVAVTLSGTTGSLYVNGKAVGANGSMTVNPASLGSTTNNYIGRSQYPDPYLDGLVDEFRIYPAALSAQEVEALVAVSANHSPYFLADPINHTNAAEVISYSGASLATLATDPDTAGALTFSKVSGPVWMSVAANGMLSGKPDDLDVGTNVFTINVTDAGGLTATVNMTVQVFDTSSGSNGMDDLVNMAYQWLRSDCTDTPSCAGADLTGDEAVTISDYNVLAGRWMKNSNLQLCYRFDQRDNSVVLDSSKFKHSGTLVNGPAWTTGKLGGALSFDGVDDYVVSEYQGIAGTNPRTVCAWVKADADPTNAQKNLYSVVSWGGNVTNGMAKWFVAIDDQTGQLAVGIYGSRIKGGMSLEDGQWHHVAAVLPDGATNINQVKLYVDGVEVSTNAGSLNAVINTAFSEVSIGSINNSTTPGVYTVNHPFRGSIDDVRIYSRALSASELAGLAQ